MANWLILILHRIVLQYTKGRYAGEKDFFDESCELL